MIGTRKTLPLQLNEGLGFSFATYWTKTGDETTFLDLGFHLGFARRDTVGAGMGHSGLLQTNI
jgi:hypothetical protein